MSLLDDKIARSLVEQANVPVTLRGYVKDWSICQWSLEKWAEVFGQKEFKEYPFRCINKYVLSNEPYWERRCTIRKMNFKKFAEAASASEEAMYFDYKYLHEWFSQENELPKCMSWCKFGFPEKGPIDTTLWVGSGGAHTPAHQDTYGVNIVTQVYGKKRWILFPPETALQPTRVPYEESSVYSGLNFYCPADVQIFKDLTGARTVDLSAGDALIVPHKWWHYVQNEDTVNISLNMWLPHINDKSARMSEAVIKMFVAQLCKDLPPEDVKLLVNPTEDDLTDTPLSELLSQLDAATRQCLEDKPLEHQAKRQKTGKDGEYISHSGFTENDLKSLINNPDNKLEIPPILTGEDLVKVIEENKRRYKNNVKVLQDCKVEDLTPSLSSIKNLINSFCQSNVVDHFRQNLLSNSSC